MRASKKRILLDQDVPAALGKSIDGEVSTAYRMGWSKLSNGALPLEAEQSGFDVFVTCDRNLKYQQNLSGRRLAIVVLRISAWPIVKGYLTEISAAVTAAKSGSYVEVPD